MAYLWEKFSTTHEKLPTGDYVSPTFEIVVNVDSCFPNKTLGNVNDISNPNFRKHINHNWYVDKNFPECGFLTRDEAHILLHCAFRFQGKNALEIGSHTGWSTVHLALADVKLDAIEPQLNHDPRVLLAIIESLRLAGVHHNVNLVAGFSPQAVEELASKFNKKWSLFFIDGNHNGEYPLNDARVCCKYSEDDAMIVFHDLAFPEVVKGFQYFVQRSPEWKTRIYHTQQIMGVAWRGHITPPRHIPDPKFVWTLPQHLLDLMKEEDVKFCDE